MQRHHTHRSIPLLAAVALLFQAWLPFFAVYQLPAQLDTGSMESLFGDKMVLCTAEGFRVVNIADLQNGTEQPSPHQQYQCALCYVAAQGNALQPPAAHDVTHALAARTHTASYPFTHYIASAEAHWQQRLTRSPPVSFAS